MVTIADVPSSFAFVSVTEFMRVMWMEVAIACFAAMIYVTLTGYLPNKKAKVVDGKLPKGAKSPPAGQTDQHDQTTPQLVAKAIRQGKIGSAVALLQEMPDAINGYVPANVAPRLLMAVAKAPDFEEAMALIQKLEFETRAFEAVVTEAKKNKDPAAGRQLQVMAGLLSIPMSPELLSLVEKAATAPANSATAEVGPAIVKEIRACAQSGDLPGAISIFEKQHKRATTSWLFNSVMDACVECGDLEKAIEYFGEVSSSGLADVISYNTLMKGYLSKGQIKDAEQLFADMPAKGLSPTLASFHGLLNFHATAGNRTGAWKVVEQMNAASVSPTSVTCSILLKGKLDSAADINKVLSLVDTIEPMDEVLFHHVADSCIRTNQLHLLSMYHSKLSSQGKSCALSAPTYGSMIKAFGQKWDMKRVRDLWADMIHQGVQPTAITLGCMIEALVANRCTAEAWKLAQQMRSDESTKPLVNTVIYSTILKGFSNAKETHKVMALYEEMQKEGVRPNNITYNTILNAFAQAGAMDRVPALLQDMKTAVPPAEPDIVTYSTLVKGFCNSGALNRAMKILKEMQAEGKISPDEVMFNSLLDGCFKEQRPTEALQLLEDMKAAGVRPSNFTLSMLVKLMGRCKRLNQAFSIVEEISKEYGLKVNIQVYTCLIQACFNNRQGLKAVSLYDKIISEGVLPDEFVYSALVQGCLKTGLVPQALHIAKNAFGLAQPTCKGTPPGINPRSLDELVYALGKTEGKAFLDEVQRGKSQAKGSSKGKDSNAPWNKSR